MSAPAKPAAKDTHPLPLSSTLHDLALLRAFDLDFASLLPPSTEGGGLTPPGDDTTDNSAVEESVERSLQFSREARAALKLLQSEAVEREGTRVDDVRGRLEDVMKGVEGDGSSGF